MDPLQDQLEQMKGYVIYESHSLPVLAFVALILLVTSKAKAQNLLHHTEAYLNRLGMRIAAEKCTSFEIRPMKGTWYMTNRLTSLKW